jgi:hypothetical protein
MDGMIPFTTGLDYEETDADAGDEKEVWPDHLAAFLSPQALPELYQRRVALGGQAILPIHCAERQNDHVRAGRSNTHIGLMCRVQRHTKFCVRRNDGSKNARLYYQAQLKYGMHHNGDHGDNAMRKKVSLNTILTLFEFCGARALLDFLESVKAAGFEIDDLADAFSVGLERAIQMFRERQKLLGWKPGQAIPIVGYDFGTRNFALCVLEVTALDAPREETYVTCTGDTKEHLIERPHFRVLRWQLLDLLDKKVKADYHGPSQVYARHDLDSNVTASADDPDAEVRRMKRKRKAEEAREDGAPKKKRARKNELSVAKRKRANSEDADAPKKKRARKAPIVIDIREDDSM